MTRGWLALSLSLSCVGWGCYRTHELAPESLEPHAGSPADADACTDGSCEPTAPADPPGPPADCRARGPVFNPGESLCQAGSLETHCSMAPPLIPCPRTYAEAVEMACEQGRGEYEAYCNACGGSTVRVPAQFFAFAMHYDASDELVGVTLYEDEPVGPCEQREFVFGKHCSAAAPGDAELVLSCRSGAARE